MIEKLRYTEVSSSMTDPKESYIIAQNATVSRLAPKKSLYSQELEDGISPILKAERAELLSLAGRSTSTANTSQGRKGLQT